MTNPSSPLSVFPSPTKRTHFPVQVDDLKVQVRSNSVQTQIRPFK